MHVVAVACPSRVVPADLATPCEVFGLARASDGRALYDVQVCGPGKRIDAGWFGIDVPHDLSALDDADTVVVPGVPDVRGPFDPGLLDALRLAHRRGARVVSICTGAFVLAAAGLLAGRRATTHWAAAPALAAAYLDVEVIDAVLFVDEGSLLTSAGAAAGLDLCLHLVRCDFGTAVAAQAAKMAVVPLERPGGQAQLVAHPLPGDDESLGPLLAWIEAHLTEDLSVASLARRAGTSARTLARRFRAQLDQTPGQWVGRARVRRAQALLEQTSLSVEQVAEAVGFASGATFRDRFRRTVGEPPTAWRRSWRPLR